jgi:glutaredoxin 3
MDTATTPVTIYSTPTCHFCQMAKEFFKAHGVEYVNHDVSTDAERRAEMLDLSGQMGVPVIVIGNNLIIGFDKRKIAELLNIKEG